LNGGGWWLRHRAVKRSPLLLGFGLALVVALAAVGPGCSKQNQGERCSRLNNNEDCEAGLTCVDGAVLGQKSDLCCPANLAGASDPRCTPNTGIGGEGGTGTGGTTTSTGGGGSGGMATGGGGSGGMATGGGGSGGSGGSGGM
jgi:hypothetical protein